MTFLFPPFECGLFLSLTILYFMQYKMSTPNFTFPVYFLSPTYSPPTWIFFWSHNLLMLSTQGLTISLISMPFPPCIIHILGFSGSPTRRQWVLPNDVLKCILRTVFYAFHAQDAFRSVLALSWIISHIHIHRTYSPAFTAGYTFFLIALYPYQWKITHRL